MNIELNLGSNKAEIKKSRPTAINILVLGDFSGKDRLAAASDGNTGIRNMFTFDPNKLDAVVARVGPTALLTLGSETVTIPITSMDSFHPDNLLDLDGLFESAPGVELLATEESTSTKTQATQTAADDDDFTRLLGGTTASPGAASPVVKSALDKLIANAVASDSPAPTIAASVRGKDPAGDMAARLRDVLQANEFQRLESAWRSLQWLGERIDYDESASLWLVDADLSAIDSWSAEFMREVAAGPGSATALVVLQDFSDSDSEQSNLHALARLASGLNTIAFAGASNSIAGLNGDIGKATALDASDFEKPQGNAPGSSAEMSKLVLGYPNLLLRQPYGKRSDPIDAFDFDELGPAPAHDAFLWGNASVVVALMWLTESLIIDDALLVTYDDGSGQAIKPPTGAYMTDSAADALLARGIVPLLAQRGGTDIRVPGLQSLANTPADR